MKLITSASILSLCIGATFAQSSESSSSSSSNSTEEVNAYGTTQCGRFGESDQESVCQRIVINSLEDFCLWGPPESDGLPFEESNTTIGHIEKDVVGYCTREGHGTRLIPEGTITGAHWIETPDFVQVTGAGDLRNIGLVPGDFGGELDPHGPDGLGNPRGSQVVSEAFGGNLTEIREWTMFVSEEQFCFRACRNGPNATTWCEHIYDTMGCYWNMPADYSEGSFDSCQAESGEPMGKYVVNGSTSTYERLGTPTPSAHDPPATSSCVTSSTIGENGLAGTITSSEASSSSSASGNSDADSDADSDSNDADAAAAEEGEDGSAFITGLQVPVFVSAIVLSFVYTILY